MDITTLESKVPADIKTKIENLTDTEELREMLDERVHTISTENATDAFEGDLDSGEFDETLDEASSLATSINNSGLLAQIGYMYTFTNGAEVEAALK